MIHDLKRQGLSISAIARKLGLDRKTVRKQLEGGVTAPVYGPRQPRPRLLETYEPYLRERILGFPDLTYQDELTGRALQVTLVFPEQADISRGLVSVLTPIGVALLGLRPGNRVRWETRAGEERALSVLAVARDTAAA